MLKNILIIILIAGILSGCGASAHEVWSKPIKKKNS